MSSSTSQKSNCSASPSRRCAWAWLSEVPSGFCSTVLTNMSLGRVAAACAHRNSMSSPASPRGMPTAMQPWWRISEVRLL
jgi:hypothetical protein